MFLGSGEVFAVEQASNIRRSYGRAARLLCQSRLRVDLFRFWPLVDGNGAFDDVADLRTSFWGRHAAAPRLREGAASLNTDMLFMDYRRDAGAFNRRMGREQRRVFGVRLWSRISRVRSDIAFFAQTGDLTAHPSAPDCSKARPLWHWAERPSLPWRVSSLISRPAAAKTAARFKPIIRSIPRMGG